jgi:nucleoside-diphosphate-sugar epimerase
LEAAIVPSSVNVIGGTFQDPPMDVRYLPVDEEHPVSPRDPYATSKHVIEITADSFARQQTDLRIASLRYPWVATTEEIEKTFAESDRSLDAVMANDLDFARDDLFAYLHLDDAAEIARAVLEADFEGHERFWAAADDTSAAVNTSELVDACYPSADVTEEFDGRESLISTEKAQRILDWEPTYSWVRK